MSNVSLHTPTMSCIPSAKKCSPAIPSGNTGLATLVRLYKAHNRPDSENQIQFFRNMPSFELAVHHAALATDDRSKRFSHQRRIPLSSLKNAKQILSQSQSYIEGCGSFHELHSWLSGAIGVVRGLGELYIYDTAFRLGAFRGLSPKFVYLHSGTRAGAKALGLRTDNGYLTVADLPEPLHTLAPHEMEDFLCIYKRHFTK